MGTLKGEFTININDLINNYRFDIEQLCKSLHRNWGFTKIDIDDLIQESYIKLWELSKADKFDPFNKSKILISIKNRLINYKKHFDLNPLSSAESLEEIM
jgi:DNA-directed RNA polymerase specialized sigma24 family protein